MKKLIALLIVLLLLGCSNTETKKDDIEEIEPIEEIEEVYVDDNPITVGIYDTSNRLVTDYYSTRTWYIDLVFTTYFTNDATVSGGSTKNIWYKYYNNYSNIGKYRIGYNITFNAGDEVISKNILHVTDEYVFNPYFYIYLYDDIHQADGAWYSHITKDKDSDSTMYTSIKLYLVRPERITSPVTITAFTYDSEDDFDLDGNYRGNSKYNININWK